jgi:NAD(P)-dependent dehydrogenase (short-subunit alcohol dehydrogenase family)
MDSTHPSSLSMTGDSVFITGAATGIGMGIATKLDRLGWTVFAGVNKTAPTELMCGASERLTVVRVNVADDEQVKHAAETVGQAVGDRGLKLLINNAAVADAAPGPVETIDMAKFRFLMEVNFWGPLRVIQAFLPLLRKHGQARIVNVTSASIYLTIPTGCSYPVSKHALAALTDHLRMEMAPFGIEVTALEPGGVKTPMITGGFAEESEAAHWASIPPPLREQYQAAFVFPGKGLEAGFEFESPEAYADHVYRKIIAARTLKPRYTLGKGVAVLPWLHRLLSKRQLERLWRKLLRVKTR